MNNPLLAAVVEARANDVRAEDIIALSIGTGSVILPPEADDVRPPLAAPRGASGTVHDLKAVAGAILDDPPDAATFIAHTLLGQPLGRDPEHPVTGGALVRVSPLVQPVRGADGGWTLPRGLGEDEFARLTELELDAIDFSLRAVYPQLHVASKPASQSFQTGSNPRCRKALATSVGERLSLISN